MDKKWVFKKNTDQDTIVRLIEQLGVTKPIATILGQRDIHDFEAAKTFFRPSIEELHDPFEMLNMQRAVERISTAIVNQENILIYGDYDVDGTTAVALMYEYITRDYEQVEYYIPDRYKEGYGISKAGVDFAIDNSFTLVIALDCGIKAVEVITYAQENGVDFIVCDHHLPGAEIPPAIVLNPKQNDCHYPFKELSGCGVGFKLVQALNETANQPLDEILPLLDLVVVSIGADIVSMTGENRLLAFFGLELLNHSPRIGFKRILDMSNTKGDLSIMDVVFSIAPRINAAGRISSGNKAVELLLAQTFEEVEAVSNLIHTNNETRKGLDRSITEEALQSIQADDWLLNAKSTVIFNPNWHKGVVGIVASRLIEKHYRPTIVLTESNGEAVGSARSVKGFNIHDAIAQCAGLLTQFGGHYFAAGLTMPLDNVAAFKLRFNEVAQRLLTDDMLIPEIEIDTEIEFRDIFENQLGGIPKFYRVLKQLAPFGPDNMAPVFVSRQVKDTGYSRLLKDEHVKLSIRQAEYPEIIVEAIAFGFGHLINRILKEPFDIVYTIGENYWQGKTTLQLMIKDIRFD
ncbi:MAG: single-stranded-DNA-specific exonuclease RecJ [Crocinitomix sp.]|nr:single-stranded-DNA-specific exonuclease RecJ [Crocinitomix sp.]